MSGRTWPRAVGRFSEPRWQPAAFADGDPSVRGVPADPRVPAHSRWEALSRIRRRPAVAFRDASWCAPGMNRRFYSLCRVTLLGHALVVVGGGCQQPQPPKETAKKEAQPQAEAAGPSKAGSPKAEGPKAAEKSCIWGIDLDQTELSWTAFKTNDKVPVGGKLKRFKVLGTPQGASASDLLDGLEFEVDGASVDTALPERDVKISTHFFGNVLDHVKIAGKIAAKEPGHANVALTLNRKTKDVPFAWTLADKQLTAKGEIDVLDFDLGGAVEALNAACKELHTGEDGKSKLWSTVEIAVSSTLVCANE
ncbi:MAG: YceI family protein [Myxococcales bacterium FL481]|nr:MAG: YceI family protein [Myxococcales bacterium FL481]